MTRNKQAAAAGVRSLSPGLWFAGGALFVLVGLVYREVLPEWFADLWNLPDYSHGLLVPFVSAWLAYDRRDQLALLDPAPAKSAFAIMIAALGLMILGTLGAEFFITRVSLLVLLTGLIAFVLGYRYLRVLALPLGFLLFMIPLPAVVFNSIAFPLQLLASQIAIETLHAIGAPALREGNIIILPTGALEVVDACSGLRSLVSLLATGVLMAVLTLRSLRLRMLLAGLTVPIAVATNGARVAGTGVLASYYGLEVAEGFLHTFSGWLVFLAALVCLGAAAALLRLFDRAL